MFTCSRALLGRWSARDFLRGRSKRGGAVHTRHTHGSKGRYKRLSTSHGLRDGRRHAANHMQGGLGVKLGGGLFGLRIPRQHLLSTMSREQFELEVYGHPNITNPYREHLDEHPALKAVMQNATVEATVVLLLPRAPRTPPPSHAHTVRQARTSSAETQGTAVSASHAHADQEGDTETWLPPSWVAIVDSVSQALATTRPVSPSHSSLPQLAIYLATLESAQGCTVTAADHQSAASIRDVLLEACHVLYQRHRKGRTLQHPAAHHSTSLSTGHAHGTFFGSAMKLHAGTTLSTTGLSGVSSSQDAALMASPPAPASTRAQTKLNAIQAATRMTLAQPQTGSQRQRAVAASPAGKGREPTQTSSAHPTSTPPSSLGATLASTSGSGAQRLLRDLHRSTPTALCVCARLAVPDTTERQTAASSHHAARAVPLLKADVDADSVPGVWGTAPNALTSLLRWHYNAQDPRAHNSDALPHDKRRLPLLVMLDASKLAASRSRTHARSAGHRGADLREEPLVLESRPASSLMSECFSEDLATTGFHLLPSMSCEQLLRELCRWSVDVQWRAVEAKQQERRVQEPVPDPSRPPRVETSTAAHAVAA